MPDPTTTPSGLVIEEVTIGEGQECRPSDTVHVHYRGTLTSGKVFDSNWDDDEPIRFPLANLIEGWKKGIPGMKIGGVRKLTIPYPLAYGERGIPGTIPPKATLVFDIKLVGLG
ncbi:MAG: FKBP-type peptidyl-prolyl cis-trans isomerase [Phycisphaeraceae bacterium]|nr:FKBP-type peptidyl-prolyl cis-trans isomerase [Phycisphaeraceae bacterium]